MVVDVFLLVRSSGKIKVKREALKSVGYIMIINMHAG